ncbi:MAG TPA: TIGR03915 family putative DNA repair protein, partial [Acetobacteraceae bacterium]
MRGIVLAHEVDWDGWRRAARVLVLEGVAPEEVLWSVGAPDDLFAPEAESPPEDAPAAFRVPRALVELAQTVIQARDPARFALLYRLLWRAHGGEREIMQDIADPEVDRANRLAQSVRRDTHKMRAFLRFREVEQDGAIRHVAWFEPEHFIVEANAPFFLRRFASMTWSILSPYRSAHWNG